MNDYQAVNTQIKKVRRNAQPGGENASVERALRVRELDILQSYCQSAVVQEVFTIATPTGFYSPCESHRGWCSMPQLFFRLFSHKYGMILTVRYQILADGIVF